MFGLIRFKLYGFFAIPDGWFILLALNGELSSSFCQFKSVTISVTISITMNIAYLRNIVKCCLVIYSLID